MNKPKNSRDPCQRSVDLAAHKPLVRQIARRIRARLPPNVGLDELEIGRAHV